MTETEQVDKNDGKDDNKVNENGYFSEDDLHILEIKDPDNAHKCVIISGLCVNCDKKNACDFIRGFAVLSKDRSTQPVVDYELSVYSCDDYPRKDDDSVYCNYPKNKKIGANVC